MHSFTTEKALAYQPPPGFVPPVFVRNEVAKILNCSVLTVRNREKSGKYPDPQRNPVNNYRIYTFQDVCALQYITYGQVYRTPILSVLYDKGYKNVPVLEEYLAANLVLFMLSLPAVNEEVLAHAEEQ